MRSYTLRQAQGNPLMRKAFTLIELLVVIAIIAVLAIVVILTLNPGQLVLQARDSNRFQDMASLQSALGYYIVDAAINGSVSLGSPNTVYASLPDPSATSSLGSQCQGLGLPSLPLGYAYHCAASSTFRSVDGTGWIPVNLRSITQGTPFAQLPIDAVNTSSSRLYYTYTTNGTQYEATASLESTKYKLGGSNDAIAGDGGTLATVYEKGTKVGLMPLDYGDPSLVGYWTFDEGAGTVAYDYSGGNAPGSWNGVGTHWTTGRIGSGAGQFVTTTNDYVAVNLSSAIANFNQAFTIIAWVNPRVNLSSAEGYFGNGYDSANSLYIGQSFGTNSICMKMTSAGASDYGGNDSANCTAIGVTVTPGQWQQVTFTFNPLGFGTRTSFLNGVLQGSYTPPSGAPNVASGPFRIGYWRFAWNGLIDDVRIYNRALSASEIQALYNGGK